ncbi:hypothetical protein LINGRAPRIM_LOCUS1640 [Linum grandiflorum]
MLQISRSPADSKPRSSCLRASIVLLALFFVGTMVLVPVKKQTLMQILTRSTVVESFGNLNATNCEDKTKRPDGSETLPRGIIKKTSNLQLRPLWGKVAKVKKRQNLFAAAVGIQQKDLVHKMVTKFLSSDFTVMLFHYDGAVDEWSEFSWSSSVVHVSALNQTKWWFAKRFMHPDIVAEYDYIFLWDEDIGVDHFDPTRYISIVASEGLEISQPALEIGKSEIHQQITARANSHRVHRRMYKAGSCDGSSNAPPCTGWVEMMTPVFSRNAWRCVWYMIQNDLIHAWGLDYRLGYCAQGDRTKNIGVVDAEYVTHYGRPTLGGGGANKVVIIMMFLRVSFDCGVRRQSYNEYKVFKRRWAKATEQDKCWIDPYEE